jgi:hypothetical protein
MKDQYKARTYQENIKSPDERFVPHGFFSSFTIKNIGYHYSISFISGQEIMNKHRGIGIIFLRRLYTK